MTGHALNFVKYLLVILSFTLLFGCGPEQKKMYTIGVINFSPAAERALIGFKQGMQELGYSEGENIRYIYRGFINDKQKLAVEGKRLLGEKVDLVFSMSTPATLIMKKLTAGTSLPVVFGPVSNPVEFGIVNNLKKPGGNITGVTFRYQEPKRFKMLYEVAPHIKRICFPYNPADRSPQMNLQRLQKVATTLNLTIVPHPLRNHEEIDAYLADLPHGIDAIYMPTDSLMASRAKDFANTARKHKLPLSTPGREGVYDGALLSFGMSIKDVGRQAARLADQIFRGVPPKDLPVEIVEFHAAVNLKTAEIIGIPIKDSLLRRAIVIKE